MKTTATSWVAVLLGIFAVIGHAAEPAGKTQTFTEISRREVKVGDHKMTMVRVQPPVFTQATVTPQQAPRPPTAEEIASVEQMSSKIYASLNLTATVYIGKPTVTEIRWRDETGKNEYRAWSNADFRYLTQLPYIETPTTVYQWFPFVDSYVLADLPAGEKPLIPKGLKMLVTGSDYLVNLSPKQLAKEETTLAGLDYLHAYYQIHFKELKRDFEKQEAENSAREKQLRENPPSKADTVIRYWPIKSRTNGR